MTGRPGNRWRVLQTLLLAASCAALAGCGKRHQIVPGEGTVRVDGKPLIGVEVYFAPQVDIEEKSPPFSRGTTDENGAYKLQCDNGETGVVVGKHIVMIRRPSIRRGPDDPKPAGPPVPFAYQSLASTPLKDVEVTPEKSVYDFELKSR